jgi:hypothetical protein
MEPETKLGLFSCSSEIDQYEYFFHDKLPVSKQQIEPPTVSYTGRRKTALRTGCVSTEIVDWSEFPHHCGATEKGAGHCCAHFLRFERGYCCSGPIIPRPD